MCDLAEEIKKSKLKYVTAENLAEYQKIYARQLLPTSDVTFKLLMGDEDHTDTLIHFLNSIPVSKDPIVSLTIENCEAPDENAILKLFRLDIRAVTDKGEIIIVEMSTSENAGMISKFVQYLARVFSTQLKTGESYLKLKKTIGVLVADCHLDEFKDDEYFWRRVRLNDERNGTNFTPLLEIYVVELPKMKHLDENHPLTYWVEFLRNPNSANLKKICKEIPGMEEAMNRYDIIKSDPKTMDRVIRIEMARQEYYGSLNDAEARGEKIGIKKGERIGIEKGKLAGAIETAKSMLRDKMPLDLIVRYSGLSVNQIRDLCIK